MRWQVAASYTEATLITAGSPLGPIQIIRLMALDEVPTMPRRRRARCRSSSPPQARIAAHRRPACSRPMISISRALTIARRPSSATSVRLPIWP
jgi:hypothetical protein